MADATAGEARADPRGGMVTSPHPLATEAGTAVLERGGNAIDAVIAASAVLTVVAPHFTGLGGDALWLAADAEGHVRGLSGIGHSGTVRPVDEGEAIPTRGPRAASTTAAAVATWERAWRIGRDDWMGSMPWGDLLDAAIGHARRGVPASASLVFWLRQRREELSRWPGFGNVFLPRGRLPDIGETLHQPALADSLAALARHGAREFYDGELGDRLATGLRAAGSPLLGADLRATRVEEAPPLRLPYRGFELLSLAPPTQGVTTLEAMGVLARFDLRAAGEGSVEHFHLMVEAIKAAFIDRDRFLGDPAFADVPVSRLLSAPHLNTLAAALDRRRARPWPAPWRHGDTVYLAAVDASGRSVSALQTIYFDWGSGVVVGDTGILWHNRGAAFSAAPGPNAWAPGKRPFHTLNPGMALERGRPRWLYGTQGADGQPQTQAALLTRLIDFGLSPAAALARPRFLLGRTFSHSVDNLKIEADVGDHVIAALAARGHETTTLPARSPLGGQAGIIEIAADGTRRGAHDPRGEGCAAGTGPGPGDG